MPYEVRRYASPVAINENSGLRSGDPTATEDVQYLTHVVKTIRGREASTVAKMQNQGWEFVCQNQGTIRAELTFRRVKPKAPFAQLGRFIASGWGAFRRLNPKMQWGGLAVLTALVFVPLIGILGGADTPQPTATPVAASTTSVDTSATPTKPSVEPTATPTPTSAGPSATPTTAPLTPVVTDTTVDVLVDLVNENMSGRKVGDQYRFTGELVRSEFWTTGASGDFFVLLATKVGSDLIVFVEESDADGWEDGTRVEMVVEDVERTINEETSHGWFEAKTVKTISGATS